MAVVILHKAFPSRLRLWAGAKDRIDGLFGGCATRQTALSEFSVVAECDAYNYAQDIGATTMGVANFKKGPWGARMATDTMQVSYGHDEVGVHAYVSIPLDTKEFVPKLREPGGYSVITPRPTLAEWKSEPKYRERMVRGLLEQNFKLIRLGMEAMAW